MTARPPTLADVPGIIAFWRVAAEDTGRPPDTAAAVEALIARDPAALILAVAGPVLVGTIIAGWDGWRCHLYRLAVAPDRRGERIACLLIEAAEERLRGLGGGASTRWCWTATPRPIPCGARAVTRLRRSGPGGRSRLVAQGWETPLGVKRRHLSIDQGWPNPHHVSNATPRA